VAHVKNNIFSTVSYRTTYIMSISRTIVELLRVVATMGKGHKPPSSRRKVPRLHCNWRCSCCQSFVSIFRI